jgi:hypothetical protein
MGKFGDIEAAKAKAALNARIKAMLMLLFQMFSGSRQNTADKIHNFIPHLKRTDRDCGALPFYSNMFTSHKTNKEHILLTMISMVVQTYWDMVDDAKEISDEVLKEFTDVLNVLEEISKDSIDNFGVYPVSSLHFSMMSKENLDKIETEDAKKERVEAEQQEEIEQQTKKDSEEAKELMDNVLEGDTSGSSTTTDDGVTAGDETVAIDKVKNEVTQLAGSSVASSSEVVKSSTDQVSTEDADACNSDCDNCDNPGCQANQSNAAADADPDELADEPADNESGGKADSEQYPDVEPLEKTVTDAVEREDNLEGAGVGIGGALADEQGGKVDTVPPMPEEEKEYQAAVDHETGDDVSADDETAAIDTPPVPDDNADGSKDFKA